MTTTFEDHNVYCQSCERDLGDCTEHGCVNRYDHAGGLCAACEAEEQGQEWEG